MKYSVLPSFTLLLHAISLPEHTWLHPSSGCSSWAGISVPNTALQKLSKPAKLLHYKRFFHSPIKETEDNPRKTIPYRKEKIQVNAADPICNCSVRVSSLMLCGKGTPERGVYSLLFMAGSSKFTSHSSTGKQKPINSFLNPYHLERHPLMWL